MEWTELRLDGCAKGREGMGWTEVRLDGWGVRWPWVVVE